MIEVTRQDDIAILRMAHGKANALDLAFSKALSHEVDAIRNMEIHGLILTGTGNIFSAGVDLLRILDSEPEYLTEFLHALGHTLETLFTYPKPMVAAINGHAIAGGCILACCADDRIMSGGRIGVPELRVGVPFPTTALEILRYALPESSFEEIVYGGNTYETSDAKRVGLIDAVADPTDLISTAIRQIKTRTQLPPTAFAMTKRQIRAPFLERMQKNVFDSYVLNLWQEPATREAIRNYVSMTFKK